jgi:hypothetical protein
LDHWIGDTRIGGAGLKRRAEAEGTLGSCSLRCCRTSGQHLVCDAACWRRIWILLLWCNTDNHGLSASSISRVCSVQQVSGAGQRQEWPRPLGWLQVWVLHHLLSKYLKFCVRLPSGAHKREVSPTSQVGARGFRLLLPASFCKVRGRDGWFSDGLEISLGNGVRV